MSAIGCAPCGAPCSVSYTHLDVYKRQGFAYTQEDAILAASGAIGHLRAEMGQDGEGFHADWTGHAASGLPDGFNVYLDTLISALRTNPAFDKPLANRDSLSRYCYGHRSGKIPDEDNSYAFRVDGGEYSTIQMCIRDSSMPRTAK